MYDAFVKQPRLHEASFQREQSRWSGALEPSLPVFIRLPLGKLSAVIAFLLLLGATLIKW